MNGVRLDLWVQVTAEGNKEDRGLGQTAQEEERAKSRH